MAKDRSEQSRYPSRYGGGWVSAAQYITECLCFLIARQQKKQLGERFWMQPYWAKVFREQIPAATTLLEEYLPEVVLGMLRDKRCWKIRSLRARSLFNHILQEKAAAQAVKDAAPVVVMEKTETVQKGRQRTSGKKSILTLLRESENEPRPNQEVR